MITSYIDGSEGLAMKLQEKLITEDPEIRNILLTFAEGSKKILAFFNPEHSKYSDKKNTSGDTQMEMDIIADGTWLALFQQHFNIKEYASEEQEEVIHLNPTAHYSITIDPLDGSSLFDVNLTVGTILGIWKGPVLTGTLVGAAYIVYGPTTHLVYTTGKGVHDCLLQNEEYIIIQENVRMKEKGKIYSIGGLRTKWTPEHSAYIDFLEQQGYKLRYSGCFVTDCNQIIFKGGGIFTYPVLTDAPHGKLRLLYELAPFALIAEQAGGAATDGIQRILDIEKKELHQRAPYYFGSTYEIEKIQLFLQKQGGKTMKDTDVHVPADVPTGNTAQYTQNYLSATKCTGKLFLFAGDQKIEHLNDDFYGPFDEGIIPADDAYPEHLFKIAHMAKKHIGVFAAQYGLIAQYGRDYAEVPYIVKMNSKSHLVKTKQAEPISKQLVSFDDVLALKKNSGLNIVGIGYTIYIGSVYEPEMLAEAGRLVAAAHREGMLAVLWVYPRGLAVPDEKDPHIIAGGAGVACCLGADFVKVNYPKKENEASEEMFKEAVAAAGRTALITSGGSSTDVKKFLTTLHKQIHISGAKGNATGRNIHQKPLQHAVRMCAAIAAITYGDKDVDFAMNVYEGTEVFQ